MNNQEENQFVKLEKVVKRFESLDFQVRNEDYYDFALTI
jgi:hypothetical protein